MKIITPLDKFLAGVRNVSAIDMTEKEAREYRHISKRKQYLYLLEGIFNDYTIPITKEIILDIIEVIGCKVINIKQDKNNIYEIDVKNTYCTTIIVNASKKRITVNIIE